MAPLTDIFIVTKLFSGLISSYFIRTQLFHGYFCTHLASYAINVVTRMKLQSL